MLVLFAHARDAPIASKSPLNPSPSNNSLKLTNLYRSLGLANLFILVKLLLFSVPRCIYHSQSQPLPSVLASLALGWAGLIHAMRCSGAPSTSADDKPTPEPKLRQSNINRAPSAQHIHPALPRPLVHRSFLRQPVHFKPIYLKYFCCDGF